MIKKLIDYLYMPTPNKCKRVKRNINKLIKVYTGEKDLYIDFDVKPYIGMGRFPFGKPMLIWFYMPTAKTIAEFLGVHPTLIYQIAKGKTWKHIS